MSSKLSFVLAALVASFLAVLSLAVISIDNEYRAFECDVFDDTQRLVSANVHYLDWSIVTRYAYDKEKVGSFPSIMLTSGVRLDCLSSAIASNEMNLPLSSAAPRDGRFLLVGATQNGDRIEVYADRFSICSLNEDKCRKNDDQTRAQITFILETRIRS